jgi:hypothetical protein
VGFAFALSPNYNKIWVPLALASSIVCAIAVGTKYMWTKTKKDDDEDERDAKELFTLASNYAAAPPQQEGDIYAQQGAYSAPNAYPQQGGYVAPNLYPPPEANAGYHTNIGPNHPSVPIPQSY